MIITAFNVDNGDDDDSASDGLTPIKTVNKCRIPEAKKHNFLMC